MNEASRVFIDRDGALVRPRMSVPCNVESMVAIYWRLPGMALFTFSVITVPPARSLVMAKTRRNMVWFTCDGVTGKLM